MLLDILSKDSYGSYNRKIAQVLGIEQAVYVEELLYICRKAIKKSKVDKYNYFKVDRNYIREQTSITAAKQRELDQQLANVGVVSVATEDKDILCLNTTQLAAIITDESKTAIQDIKINLGAVRQTAATKETKKQQQIESLKALVTVGNKQLNAAFKEWIDGVMVRPDAFLSERSVSSFIEKVMTYSHGDVNIALLVVDIAANNGWRDPVWAIEQYERSQKLMPKNPIRNVSQQVGCEPTVPTSPQVSDEVF